MAKRKTATPASQRQLRVGEEVRHIIAGIFQADRLHDPDLVGKSITVTEVRVSPDLRNATVFVIPLGGPLDSESDEVETILAALKRAAPHITGLTAGELRARRAPRLTFERDGSFEQAQTIDSLLRSPGVAQDLPE